jgi:GNAT superfamily N-acetyltransferase
MIRLIADSDARPLRTLIMQYLKETYADGGDFPPTLENAAAFTKHAIDGSKEGDPCLVAVEDGKIVGFVVGRGLQFPGMTTRDKTIRSWGSYVAPAYRGRGIAISLFMLMGRLARHAGYTRLLGMTHGTRHEENALRAVRVISNMRDVGRVLVADLRPRVAEDEDPGPGPDDDRIEA